MQIFYIEKLQQLEFHYTDKIYFLAPHGRARVFLDENRKKHVARGIGEYYLVTTCIIQLSISRLWEKYQQTGNMITVNLINLRLFFSNKRSRAFPVCN